MRLWSLHPRYLDPQGLVALWREALLAQAVLAGKTRGYTRHPQLARFRQAPDPVACIAAYLGEVHAEASRRGYRFDAGKIGPVAGAAPLTVTEGQLRYEGGHLAAKLAERSPGWLDRLPAAGLPEPHPLFRVAEGGIADWEAAPPEKPPQTPSGRKT